MISPREELAMVGSESEAARLRLEWDHLLAKPSLPADDAAEIREAMGDLDDRWPGAHEHGLVATEDELGGFGKTLRAHRQARRREHGIDATEAAKRRRARDRAAAPSASGRRRDHAQAPPRRPGRRGGRGLGRRAADELGATALAGGIGDTVLAFLRIGFGLALAYLVLSPRGSRGLSGVLNGITSSVELVIAPVDPLGGRAALRQARPAPASRPGRAVQRGHASEAGRIVRGPTQPRVPAPAVANP